MAHASEPRLLSLHGLRLRGFAEPDAVAEVVDLDADAVRPHLDGFVAEGLAIYRDGRMSGFALTAEGRSEHERLLADELDAAGARPVVDDAYRRFLELNVDLLAVCTDWQMRDVGGTPTPNDHADGAYDDAVIERLAGLNEQVQPICDDLAATLDRFSGYAGRLGHAVEKVTAGDRDYFTKPLFPSYHTIWFELHEDLLATLGIDRAAEVPR